MALPMRVVCVKVLLGYHSLAPTLVAEATVAVPLGAAVAEPVGPEWAPLVLMLARVLQGGSSCREAGWVALESRYSARSTHGL